MLFVVAIPVVALMLRAAARRGPRVGLWYGWAAALLVPHWLYYPIQSYRLDIPTIVAGVGLFLLAQGPPAGAAGGRRLRAADVTAGALLASMSISQVLAGEFSFMTVPKLAAPWLLPYLVGRSFVRSPADPADALGPMVAATTALALVAVVESITRVNLASVAAGRFAPMTGEVRMGLLRAMGTFCHPIILGMALLMLLPWALEARRRAGLGAGPRWWRLTPWVTVAGLITSISRGPMLAGALMLYLVAAARARRRALMLGLGLVAVVVGLAAREAIVATLGHVGNEDTVEKRVVIGNVEREYTGSIHRLLLFEVYGDLLADAGLFGFGHSGEEFQPGEGEGLEVLGSIDDHYIVFTLWYGYLGMGLFVLLMVLTLADLARVARAGGPAAALATALFVAVVVVALNLFTVWLAPDFARVWMFTAGLATALRQLPAKHPDPAGVEAVEFVS